MKDKSINLNKDFDLKPHIQRIHANRIFIIITTLIFIVLGVVYYFIAERNYQVRVVVLPYTNTSGPSVGGLSGLASIAGLNLNNNTGTSVMSANLYPQIVSSTVFLQRLSETEVELENIPDPVTYSEYILNHYKPPAINKLRKYTIGLPQVIIDGISGSDEIEITVASEPIVGDLDIQKLSKKEKSVIASLARSIKLEVNNQFGTVEISTKMPEAKLAAQMADQMLALLQELVHEYKTKKASEELDFLQSRYVSKRSEYDSVQNALAEFRDQNIVISTATGRTKLDWLENEFALQAAVLQELAKNLETQKLELSKQSPSFAVIQPAVLPLDPVKESKVLIFFISMLFGLFISIGVIYLKVEYLNFKSFLKKSLDA